MNLEVTNSRDVAVLALRDRDGNVSAHLERLLGRGSAGRADVALARELALGVVRRRRTLEAVLRAFLDKPDRRLPGALHEILLVGLYQVIFLDRVPQFAAVDEAVKQAARFRHRRQGGMVNGVLRAVTRSLSPSQLVPAPPSPQAIPVAPDSHRTIDRAVFADPAADPAAYLAEAYSLPAALAERWVQRTGSLADATDLAAHADARAPLILRVNQARSSVAAAVAELDAAGAEPRPHANGLSIAVKHCNVIELDLFAKGAVQPQDPTATAVGLAARPQPGWNVLDYCAAPGTKTTHLAELMENRGSIMAVDVSAEKLRQIEDNCRRMGVDIVRTVLAEASGVLEPRSFDLVLADVPCSNTGVLARRAEARWRFSEDALPGVVRDERLLARAAAQYVKPGGRLVYSTCSIEPEEDSEVARWVQRNDGRVRLIGEELTLPGGAADPAQWHDGGYVAIFQAQ